jgi:hypothetical protein
MFDVGMLITLETTMDTVSGCVTCILMFVVDRVKTCIMYNVVGKRGPLLYSVITLRLFHLLCANLQWVDIILISQLIYAAAIRYLWTKILSIHLAEGK